MPDKRFGCGGEGKGVAIGTLGMKGAIDLIYLIYFATAILLYSVISVFVGYAKNSSGISEARELLRTN